MSRPRAAILFVCLSLAFDVVGQTPTQKPYEPRVGQPGKDVVWVPTPDATVEKMLDLAKVTAADTVMDLGSGEGRIVIAAAKRGARAIGIEYNPDLVELSKRNAAAAGVSARASFVQGDVFLADLQPATVVTLFLLPSLNVKLRPTILNMKPGTRVVSHAFTMDDWQPDQVDSSEGRTAYMWIVPAKVGGTWRVQVAGGPRYETAFIQQYQNVGGSAKVDGKPVQFSNGKLRGETISFTIEDGTGKRDFSGQVVGDKIEGTAKGAGGEAKWTATRVAEAR